MSTQDARRAPVAEPRQPRAGAETGAAPTPLAVASVSPTPVAVPRGAAAGPDPISRWGGETSGPRGLGEGAGPLVITVLGTPGPQGSKKHVGKGVMIESSKKVAPWREAVVYAAARARVDALHQPYDGPVEVEFCFTLARPKSAPKSRVHPDRMPDLSKLIRSTEDALKTAGVLVDDARIVRYRNPRKVYTGSADPDVLEVPGAVIRVWPITPEGTT